MINNVATCEKIAEIEQYIDFLQNKVSAIKENSNDTEERKLETV